jgi:hypothetical protein
MKIGLSNHQSREIWYGGIAIQGDLDAITFIPMASIILKFLRFKVVE